MRALLVEDDGLIGAGLQASLARNGWTTDWVQDGASASAALRQHDYLVILLDLGLPGVDGMTLLKQLRAGGDRTPVVVLTARDRLQDRVAGLDQGADDYLVKPFEVPELLARMRAVVRRRDGTADPVIGTGHTRLDTRTKELDVHGVRWSLAAREYALMHALLERPGAILSRDQLESRLYGWGGEVSSNAVDVLIHALRKKIGVELIRNVRGLGWRIGASGEHGP